VTTATITPRALSRSRRMAELDRLAVDSVLAFHLSATSETILVTAYACPLLPLESALSRWRDVIAEYRRYLGLVGSDPAWDGTELDVSIADRDAAMDDLLDGTSTYRGRRPR